MASSSKKSRMEEQNTSLSQSKKLEVRIINDPIHGVIQLHPLLLKIINTPQFGRLKDIKQLGVAYWIFPGASHNRFEHSIGTSYLCGKLIDNLREMHSHEKNGKIEITEVESLCVKVAGLCHDLGHGPFSHFFDQDYIPRVVKPGDSKWKHEQASCDLFDFMLNENKELSDKFEEYDLKEQEKRFIKDLILGEKSKEAEEKKSSIVYEGSGSDGKELGKEYKKSFLYEIVSNKRNGIDCDKFDYFARDCHNVGVQSNFDCQRYFLTTRIMPIGDELQICVRDKEVFNLYELFHTRSSLHQRVYQHKTEAPIKDMLVEALSKVDKKFEISDSILPNRPPNRYTNLTDSIIHDICISDANDEDTKEAQNLILKIKKRQLYKFCGEIYLPIPSDSKESPPPSDSIEPPPPSDSIESPPPSDSKESPPPSDSKESPPPSDSIESPPPSDSKESPPPSDSKESPPPSDSKESPPPSDSKKPQPSDSKESPQRCFDLKKLHKKTKEGIKNEIEGYIKSNYSETLSNQIFISVAVIDSSKKGKDPIKLVNFFNKSGKRVKFPDEQHKQMGPAVWVKKIVRVYAKSPDWEDEVRKCFKEMCNKEGFPTVTEIPDDDPDNISSPTKTPERNKSSSNSPKPKPKPESCRDLSPEFETSSVSNEEKL